MAKKKAAPKKKSTAVQPSLPVFRYYRDPFGTGAFEPCDDPCDCCGRARGYRYQGFLYAEEEIETICPWCVADGSAARKFDGIFVDDEGLSRCRPRALAELTKRTPEFFAFQGAKWLVHCGEPAVYLTPAGYAELKRYGEETLQSVKDNLPIDMSEKQKQGFLRSLRRDGSCVAHVFECLHCQKVIAYGECD
jgi:uncharacterized protein CbrC (UPF0167 family)